LLDTAAARVRMSLDTVPHIFGLMDAQISSLQRELEALDADKQLSRLNASQQENIRQVEQEIAQLNEECEEMNRRYQEEKQLADEIQSLMEAAKNTELTSEERQAAQHSLTEKQQQLDAVVAGKPLIFTSVDETVIADIIADWTGVPAGSVLKDELANLLQLESLLEKRVVGQSEAIHAIAQSLRAAKAGLKTNDSPLGVFLLSGPSGVGKTETALALADALFGGEKSLITINLSEYREAHTVSQLKGSPPGYVGYGEGGVLTEAVRQKPYSVVLLDEVEKAHKDILNLFYQVFDKGIMRDGEGREIDFKNTVILMTSNLGANELTQLLKPQEPEETEETVAEEGKEQNAQEQIVDTEVELSAQMPDSSSENASVSDDPVETDETPEFSLEELAEAIRPILTDHFQAALLARMQVVPYRPLEKEALAQIVRLKLDKIADRLYEAHQTRLSYSEDFAALLADSCTTGDSGARNIDHLLNRQVMPAIAQSFLQWQQTAGHMPEHAKLELGENGIDVLFE
jgi:type VI secretion ATPase, clpV1 family